MNNKERLKDIKLELKQRPYLRHHQVEWLIEHHEKLQKQLQEQVIRTHEMFEEKEEWRLRCLELKKES